MGKKQLAAWGLVAWAGLGGPALAEVVDLPDLLPAAQEQALQQSLAALGRHKADVVFVQGEGSDLPALAAQKFRERGLGERDLLIAIDPAQRKVGVRLGEAFGQRGVGRDAIQSLLRQHFYPLAKEGKYDEGAAAFAKAAIAAAGRNQPRGAAPMRQAGSTSLEGPRSSGGGFPWGTVLVVAALGGAAWFVFKTAKGGSGGGSNPATRVAAVEQAHARIVGLALRLDEVGTLVRFAPDNKRQAYRELENQAERILPEAKAMGDAVAEARAFLAGRKGEQALQAIAAWEGPRASRLESEVASAVTALDGLEREGLEGTKAIAMGQEASQLVDRLGSLKARHAQACARAPEGYEKDAEAEHQLAETHRLLSTPPVDLARAGSALDGAEKAIEAHAQEVRQALERNARSNQNDGYLGGSSGFSSLPIFIPIPSYGFGWGGGYGHDHHTTIINNNTSGSWDSGSTSGASESSGGGFWGDSSSSSWDSGGGGSWGDSSGGDSWSDSGGGDFGGGGDW